jgi:hypothetical protein
MFLIFIGFIGKDKVTLVESTTPSLLISLFVTCFYLKNTLIIGEIRVFVEYKFASDMDE